MFALGRGGSVIAVTRYCTEPAVGVRRLERIGGTKNPDVARICALQPDLVIVNAEENRKEDFEALEHAGLTIFVSFPLRVRNVAGLLLRLGELVGARAGAEEFAQEQDDTLRHFGSAGKPRLLRVFCPIWRNPWMSFNQDTYGHDILWLAGGENVCATRGARYCEVTLEEVAATAPQVILLPDEPYRFTPKVLSGLELLRDTPAWRTNRIHFIDGKAVSWYGTRTAMALRALRAYFNAEEFRGAG